VTGPAGSGVVGEGFEQSLLGCAKQRGEVVVGDRSAMLGPCWSSHGSDRVVVDDPLVVRPADRGAQNPESASDDARGTSVGLPSGERRSDQARGQRCNADPTDRIALQEARVGAVADIGRRLPGLVGIEPAGEDGCDGDHGGRHRDRPAGHCFSGKLAGVRAGVALVAVEGHRPLGRAPCHWVGADGDPDLPHARSAFADRSHTTLVSHGRPM
jgi:hypothetical protein